jgi:lysophospholipase L1-like esterase
MGYTGYLQKSDFPDVVYEFKPEIDSYFKLADFKTNSQGLRDKEYSLEKPANTFRVAVIGGSFTVPAGVEINEAFHSLLEDRFNKENPDFNYEFINFGVSGYRINNKIATLEHKVLKYNPDLILFILDGSQFTEDEEKEFKPKSQKNQFFQSFTYKLISKNKLFTQDNKDQEFLDEHKTDLDQFNLELQKLSNISQKNKVPICVVVLDHDYMHYELSGEIKRLVENNNLYYSNTIASFQDIDISELTIYKIDIHPNSKANQIFADSIYMDLKNQSLIDKK